MDNVIKIIYIMCKLLNNFNNTINMIANIGPDDKYKLEIMAALFLFKNSMVNKDEKIYK
jgi:hypothetical protein